jgi:hypothetical protein
MEIGNRMKLFLPNFNFTQFINKGVSFYKCIASYFPSFSADTKCWYKGRYVYIGVGFASLSFFVVRYFLKPGSSVSNTRSSTEPGPNDITEAVKSTELFSQYVKARFTAQNEILPPPTSGTSWPVKMTAPIMRTLEANAVMFKIFVKPSGCVTIVMNVCLFYRNEAWHIDADAAYSDFLPFPIAKKSLHSCSVMQKFIADLFGPARKHHFKCLNNTECSLCLIEEPSKINEIAEAVKSAELFSQYLSAKLTANDELLQSELIRGSEVRVSEPELSQLTAPIMRTKSADLVAFNISVTSDNNPLQVFNVRLYYNNSRWNLDLNTYRGLPPFFTKRKALNEDPELQQFIVDLFTSGEHVIDKGVGNGAYSFSLIQQKIKIT